MNERCPEAMGRVGLMLMGCMLILVLSMAYSSAWAKTIKAGTQLGTQAVATYSVDGAAGTPAVSNDVITLVKGVDAVSIVAENVNMGVAAKMAVNVPFTVKNTGNQTTTFTLDVKIPEGATYQAFWDKNNNATQDQSEPSLSAGDEKKSKSKWAVNSNLLLS